MSLIYMPWLSYWQNNFNINRMKYKHISDGNNYDGGCYENKEYIYFVYDDMHAIYDTEC